jgi:hypothetical protein
MAKSKGNPVVAAIAIAVMCFVGVLITGGLAVDAALEESKLKKIREGGVVVPGEVVNSRHYVSIRTDSDGDTHRTDHYFLTVKFNQPDTDLEFSAEQEFRHRIYQEYRSASRREPMPTSVLVVPDKPSDWTLVEAAYPGPAPELRTYSTMGSILLLLMGGGLFWMAFLIRAKA